MNFKCEKISVTGNFRSNNEDAIACCENENKKIFWMVIADGMGGHKAGEVASEMFVEEVKEQFGRVEEQEEINWNEWLLNTIETANLHIFDTAEKNPELQGMGTTGVVLICQATRYYVAWVGDSRAYLWRSNQIKQMTQDHTAIQYLLDKGAISKKEAERSNTKHILAKAIGIKASVEVDIVTGKLQAEDVWLLSTDGIHDFLTSKEIEAYIKKFTKQNNLAKELVDLALANGSTDNLTFGAVKIDDLL
ncbi:Stp1/IreP family PP2C-type Ser/Thr phosphatase [Aliikangiella sp. IMCC44359]|uniref:Stp1/IreP family PP2C-type Ser/Thr phosphatase n=1 Tax=Aliikangiella sp. IMCC44359 TaxID=3459125 RepID=UPI00403AA018